MMTRSDNTNNANDGNAQNDADDDQPVNSDIHAVIIGVKLQTLSGRC